MNYQYNDGGRAAAGYKGTTSDCVTRAIAIVTGLDYRAVYDRVNQACQRQKSRSGKSSARTGVAKDVTRELMAELEFRWVPVMKIGSGCKVHLRGEELPAGRIIAKCSRHVVAVIDGVVHDTYDSTRGGTRCVYGYWVRS